MPAKFIKTYKYTTPDGMQFGTLRDAQQHELNVLLPGVKDAAEAIDFMLNHKSEIVAILRQKERKHSSPSNRRPRKDKGGTHKKAAPVEAAA